LLSLILQSELDDIFFLTKIKKKEGKGKRKRERKKEGRQMFPKNR